MKLILIAVGIMLIALSIYGRYWRGKRAFERRNVAGLETFKSYNDSLKTKYYENFIHFLGVAAFMLGLALILFAWFGYDEFMRMASPRFR